MHKKSFLFVANWKMAMTAEQTMQYVRDHISALATLSVHTGNKIVLCPSFPMLGAVHYLSADTTVQVGAQNCSSFPSGAYTGEVSAVSLAEFGCQYCIIGHSERRQYCHETDDDIARKARLCMLAGISPIICVGEVEDTQDIDHTKNILDKQLSLLADYLIDLDGQQAHTFWIAYEPVWAIGTGKVPNINYLREVYAILGSIVAHRIASSITVHYLYGGSISEKNIESIADGAFVDGFLVGGASLDFQKFKNMISLCV